MGLTFEYVNNILSINLITKIKQINNKIIKIN